MGNSADTKSKMQVMIAHVRGEEVEVAVVVGWGAGVGTITSKRVHAKDQVRRKA
jgi:hypothetical protein